MILRTIAQHIVYNIFCSIVEHIYGIIIYIEHLSILFIIIIYIGHLSTIVYNKIKLSR